MRRSTPKSSGVRVAGVPVGSLLGGGGARQRRAQAGDGRSQEALDEGLLELHLLESQGFLLDPFVLIQPFLDERRRVDFRRAAEADEKEDNPARQQEGQEYGYRHDSGTQLNYRELAGLRGTYNSRP